jgi:hypothetical protein
MTADSAGRDPDAGLFEAEDAATALDLLLSDAALGVVRRFLPSASTLRFAAGLARAAEVARASARCSRRPAATCSTGRRP